MSSLYQKRGIFYYQGKDEDGNRIQKSLRTRDKAEAEAKKEKMDERFSYLIQNSPVKLYLTTFNLEIDIFIFFFCFSCALELKSMLKIILILALTRF